MINFIVPVVLNEEEVVGWGRGVVEFREQRVHSSRDPRRPGKGITVDEEGGVGVKRTLVNHSNFSSRSSPTFQRDTDVRDPRLRESSRE